MTPHELRLGNKVYWNEQIVTVYKISLDRVYVVHPNRAFEIADPDKLSPIPLTSDILRKLGFAQMDSGVDKDDEDYHEWLEADFPVIGWMAQSDDRTHIFNEEETIRIYHLHKFQNLYYEFTGKEYDTQNI